MNAGTDNRRRLPFRVIQGNRERLRRLQRLQQIHFRRLLPAILTLFAVCLGFASIRLAGEARFELAVFAIIGAIILDASDGRIARFLQGSSRFGAELDSLADFLSFGCAPAWLLYQWGLHEAGLLGWTVALGYVLCCALRLARFGANMHTRANWQQGYFEGVPAPAGALLVMTPMYLYYLEVLPASYILAASFLSVFAAAALMISKLPTFSLKFNRPRIARDLAAPLSLIFVMMAVLMVAFPWRSLSIAAGVYLLTLPVSGLAYFIARRRHQAKASTPAPLHSVADEERAG